jgi:hypothetical protein
MKELVMNFSSVTATSSTSRSTYALQSCCGWSATQPRASRLFCLLAACLSYCAINTFAADPEGEQPPLGLNQSTRDFGQGIPQASEAAHQVLYGRWNL